MIKNKQQKSKLCAGDIIKLLSKAFNQGEVIPSKYSYEEGNISPPLEWSSLPKNTKSLALILEDPDAPMFSWTHWIVYNIPITQTDLPEGIPPEKEVNGIKQGINSWKKNGYGGPCPPWGTHRYVFKLYALDTELEIDPEAPKSELINQIKNHAISEAKLVGKYKSHYDKCFTR